MSITTHTPTIIVSNMATIPVTYDANIAWSSIIASTAEWMDAPYPDIDAIDHVTCTLWAAMPCDAIDGFDGFDYIARIHAWTIDGWTPCAHHYIGIASDGTTTDVSMS